MKTIISPTEHASALAHWRGAQAKLWLFHVTFNRMVIQLWNGDEEALYVLAVGCERIAGPLRWESADIAVRTDPPNQWAETRRRVVDSAAGFELLCSDVVMVRRPPEVPPDPFNGFFVDLPDTCPSPPRDLGRR